LAHARPSEQAARSFVDGIAQVVLKAAWPSAQYESWSFGGIRAADDNMAAISFRINARSFWTDGPIWLDVDVIVDDDLNVRDVRWGDYSANVRPGTAASLLSKLVDSGSRSTKASYDRIHVKNACSRPIMVAIHFLDLDDNWRTKGWYRLSPGERAYIDDTRNSVYYIYAESADGELHWIGDDFVGPVQSEGGYGFAKEKIESRTWGEWTSTFSCNGLQGVE